MIHNFFPQSNVHFLFKITAYNMQKCYRCGQEVNAMFLSTISVNGEWRLQPTFNVNILQNTRT